jgi:hypothetical protein
MGRERKSISDLESLYDKDPDMVLRWLRGAGGVSFEMNVQCFIERWIGKMDKKRYQKVKAVVDQAVKEHLEPDTPDNVIPFRRRA